MAKEYRCKYCGAKTAKYSTICVNCSQKRKLVRELLRLVNDIKEKAYVCPHCKQKFEPGDNYCSKCGRRVSWR